VGCQAFLRSRLYRGARALFVGAFYLVFFGGGLGLSGSEWWISWVILGAAMITLESLATHAEKGRASPGAPERDGP
jgi:hypothetical protein